ncbi:DUF1129 domain-containing protein [Vagococcus elongatus]|uniref:DUF1129 domain-containing protein n=1 Tax=Vagococcus elongatus TaxID=180344 RepID=A0A430AUX6_9ENTE|nr:DUF1129 domain-containing protein [Vagococcus elongatus]RSU11851.1 hypothetical protein CBF29_06955 [Vagococcus elongatus]
METQELRELVKKNRELEEQLTKRNQQYIFDLKKALDLASLTEEKKVFALSEMLPLLVEGQKTGQTARQLFGTVSERTEYILAAPEPTKKMEFTELWLDNSLMLLGFLGLISGVMPLISKTSSAQQYGILTLLIGSFTGGAAFYFIGKYVYLSNGTADANAKKPGMLKSMFLMAGIILGWMVVFMGTIFIPLQVNPILDPVFYVIIGGGAFLIRWYIRKKYNITGSMFTR